MPKRKADNGNNETAAAVGAKKPRAASFAVQADGIDPLASAQVQPGLVVGVAMQTSKLAQAIDTEGRSFSQRMRAVADLLKADATQGKSQLDLSLVPEDDEVSAHAASAASRQSIAFTVNCR